MTPGALDTRFGRSPHLVELIAELERAAQRLRHAGDPDGAEDIRADAAVASMQLDGSAVTAPPENPQELAGRNSELAAAAGPTRRQGTWLDAMATELEEASDDQIVALEYLGVRAALAADDLTGQLLTAPLETCRELHRRLTAGLLDSQHAGEPRITAQAVHDASVGRIIYFPTAPEQIPTRLNLLAGWLQTTGAREHALVTSGVLHFELLRIHPYEAANGRLARAAARLALRARGLDPHGLAAPEPILARDPIGYYEEVARTLRRRDLTIWLERWGEAVVGGLRESLARLGLTDESGVSPRTRSFLSSWDREAFTIAEYRATAGVGPEQANSDLRELLEAGLIRRVPGSRGLRFERG